MTWGAAVAAGLQLALLLVQYFINQKSSKDIEIEQAFKDGINAIKNRDASIFNFAVQRINIRMRK